MSEYTIREDQNNYGRIEYVAYRDGSPTAFRSTNRGIVDAYIEQAPRLPDGYALSYSYKKVTFRDSAWVWSVKAPDAHLKDPDVASGADLTRVIDEATRHAAKAPELAVIAAAEKATADEQERVTAERAGKATDRQIDYILQLIAARKFRGDQGGFMAGPTDRPGIMQLTQAEASAYIDSLKEQY